jgi:hypothetical protein
MLMSVRTLCQGFLASILPHKIRLDFDKNQLHQGEISYPDESAPWNGKKRGDFVEICCSLRRV